ncbi:hypothetical protein [Emcibacter sp. SYSU 3D8]|uniref:hypothetical protein n=1 Tax=Emcibacter sp. SYSU 3D8 TaxID=3133969 RepID=UPI0031FF40EB
MTPRIWVFAAAGVWLAFFIASFVAFNAMSPTGDDFARGMKRAGTLLTWQAGAMSAAMAAFVLALRRSVPRTIGTALAGFAPMVVMVLELLVVVALVVWVATRDPADRIERFYYPDGSPTQRLR